MRLTCFLWQSLKTPTRMSFDNGKIRGYPFHLPQIFHENNHAG